MTAREFAVEFSGVKKSFGDCQAIRQLSFTVRRGSIHALIGENGAGKSTAMKILYGLYQADAGTVRVEGKECAFESPQEAIAAGIGMVHQHFMLAGTHSVLDNVLLGAENASALAPIRRREARARLAEILESQKWKLDLDAVVENLPVGLQQRVEILKLLFRRSQILILDEPTAVLTPQEADELFRNLRALRDSGCTVIVITHKLKEVMKLADAVTVMRAGEVVGSREIAATNAQELAELMVGRKVDLQRRHPGAAKGEPVFTGRRLLGSCDLTVHAGEILGVAGVEGNGQAELIESLVFPGEHWHPDTEAKLAGKDISGLSTRELRALGLGVLAEDRLEQSLLPEASAADNFLLGQEWRSEYQSGGCLKIGRVREAALAAMKEYDVRPLNPDLAAAKFSGGNQQKLVVARELGQAPRFLIAAQPTRGVDVGAIEFIHARLRAARDAGAGILLVSSELDEILALADRIIVLFEKKIVAELSPQEADEKKLGAHMGGERQEGKA